MNRERFIEAGYYGERLAGDWSSLKVRTTKDPWGRLINFDITAYPKHSRAVPVMRITPLELQIEGSTERRLIPYALFGDTVQRTSNGTLLEMRAVVAVPLDGQISTFHINGQSLGLPQGELYQGPEGRADQRFLGKYYPVGLSQVRVDSYVAHGGEYMRIDLLEKNLDWPGGLGPSGIWVRSMTFPHPQNNPMVQIVTAVADRKLDIQDFSDELSDMHFAYQLRPALGQELSAS